jgi:hypothetical protein
MNRINKLECFPGKSFKPNFTFANKLKPFQVGYNKVEKRASLFVDRLVGIEAKKVFER